MRKPTIVICRKNFVPVSLMCFWFNRIIVNIHVQQFSIMTYWHLFDDIGRMEIVYVLLSIGYVYSRYHTWLFYVWNEKTKELSELLHDYTKKSNQFCCFTMFILIFRLFVVVAVVAVYLKPWDNLFYFANNVFYIVCTMY